MNNTASYTNSSYGKRSIWQWVVIYAVIAAAVYGLFYYFVYVRRGMSYSTPQQNTNQGMVTIPSSGNPNQMQNIVSLTQDGYLPQILTIKAGSSVIWINNSGTNATVSSDPHPTHTDYPPLNLGKFSDGGKLSLVFPKPGTYKYHNHLNASETGTIIVQ